MRSRFSRIPISALVGLLAAVLVVGCGSGTQEVDSKGDGPEGPLPTAPANFSRNSPGEESALTGSVDVNDLIRRIDSLTQEDDLCTLLTGQAMADVTGADIDLTSLLSNPTGFSQLFSALDKVFGHMAQIAPAELIQPISEMQSVWATLSTLNVATPDAEAQASALISSPVLRSSQDALGVWVVNNCRR
jgi:hypothetical protein